MYYECSHLCPCRKTELRWERRVTGQLFMSCSFAENTGDNHLPSPATAEGQTVATLHKDAKMSARQQTVKELFQTEKNYVGILHTIIKVKLLSCSQCAIILYICLRHHCNLQKWSENSMSWIPLALYCIVLSWPAFIFASFKLWQTFKEEIENTNQPGGPLLDPQHVKAIFGGIPPIFDVHVKLRDELGEIVNNWQEDACIGDTIIRHVRYLCIFHTFAHHYTVSYGFPSLDRWHAEILSQLC